MIRERVIQEKEQDLSSSGLDMRLVWAWLESEPRPRANKMAFYIRRMNKMGHWLTIDSSEFIPPFGWENFLRINYGPGRYNIARAEQGLAGMQSIGTYNIGYEHQLLQWVPQEPTLEYIHAHNITGDLITARLADTRYFYVPRDSEELDEQVRDQLDQGIQGFKGGWVIIRVLGLPYQ